MIDVSILGGETPDGGELLRLLAIHPEVELADVQATGLEGIPVASHHHGLIGETSISFTATVDYSRCDVLFVCNDSLGAYGLAALREARPELRIIMLRTPPGLDLDAAGVVYGLPEINRKQLVRGATAAVVPRSLASMALVALYPFAMNLLLSGNVTISVTAPKAVMDSCDIKATAAEVSGRLARAQKSFDGDVDIRCRAGEARRSALMDITLACPLSLQQSLDLYDIYDDHRFAFVTTAPVGVSEVAGTNKCIVSVSKGDPASVSLGVAADCRLRGAAGEAVHIMNLMFGLHEKTGLALKAIDFEPVGPAGARL